MLRLSFSSPLSIMALQMLLRVQNNTVLDSSVRCRMRSEMWILGKKGVHLPMKPDKGVVNDEFLRIQTSKSEEEPYRVIQMINSYCVDVDKILSELKSSIDSADVDFYKLAEQAQKVNARSLCIGAEHMRLACADLIQACEHRDMENLSQALGCLKNEFVHTRNKLDTVAQMEEKVIKAKANEQK